MPEDVTASTRAMPDVTVNALPTPETLPPHVRKKSKKEQTAWLNKKSGLGVPTNLQLGQLTVDHDVLATQVARAVQGNTFQSSQGGIHDWSNRLVADLVQEILAEVVR